MIAAAVLVAPDFSSIAQAKPTPSAVDASYYGREFAGRKTANGEVFDPEKLTAAHKTLPFGSLVEVLNPQTKRKVIVRINDRGPFHANRTLDLSEAAARAIGMVTAGTAKVLMRLVRRP